MRLDPWTLNSPPSPQDGIEIEPRGTHSAGLLRFRGLRLSGAISFSGARDSVAPIMVTLAKRATPAQAAIWRMIDGAIRQAQHAHPQIVVSPKHRSSIAKRATGLISAATPGLVSAASRPPKEAPSGPPTKPFGGALTSEQGRERVAGTVQLTDRSRLGPLRELRRKLQRELWGVDDLERKKAYVHVLRLIAELGVRR